MSSTSIIVTTYNSPKALDLCLRSLLRMRVLPTEIVVADDGSTSETTHVVDALAQTASVPIRHVWQPDRGFRVARIRNAAASVSRGAHLVFLDGDMVVHPDFLADHLAFHREGIFLQGGRLNTSQTETDRLLAGGSPRFHPFLPMAHGLRGELKRKHALRIPWLARWRTWSPRRGVTMACNMGMRRSDFELVNGFDEDFEGWGQEDDDLAWRLNAAGVTQRRLRFAGLALHLWHPSRRPADAEESGNVRLLRSKRTEGRIACRRGLSLHVQPAATRHVRVVDLLAGRELDVESATASCTNRQEPRTFGGADPCRLP